MGQSQIVQQDNNRATVNTVNTRYGKSQVGSFLSYQVSVTESNFKAHANIDAVQRLHNPNSEELTYPRFPLRDLDDDLEIPDGVSDLGRQFLTSLQLDENEINTIEHGTRQQASSEKWKSERKYRFTSSQFHLISKRQRNHETFANNLLNPKDINSKYLEHGKKYEPVALLEYEKYMYLRRTPVQVKSSGFVVSKSCCIIGASPDGNIIDRDCIYPFGLAEVKCPYTKYNVTPLDACSDSKFFMEKTSDTECVLRKIIHTFTMFKVRWE